MVYARSYTYCQKVKYLQVADKYMYKISWQFFLPNLRNQLDLVCCLKPGIWLDIRKKKSEIVVKHIENKRNTNMIWRNRKYEIKWEFNN